MDVSKSDVRDHFMATSSDVARVILQAMAFTGEVEGISSIGFGAPNARQ
jgi:hypothetical protein